MKRFAVAFAIAAVVATGAQAHGDGAEQQYETTAAHGEQRQVVASDLLSGRSLAEAGVAAADHVTVSVFPGAASDSAPSGRL